MNSTDSRHAIDSAMNAVLEAVDRADRTDAASLDPVLAALDHLQDLLAAATVPTHHHVPVRAGLDRVMGAVGTLVKDLREARDEVGKTLAKLRAHRRPAFASVSRIDMHS